MMNELSIRQMQISAAKEEIRCCNELNQIYGLTLTEADITELVELRGQALRATSLDENLLKRYDCVLTLKNGSVTESGSFDELMAKKGYFYSLFTVSQ